MARLRREVTTENESHDEFDTNSGYQKPSRAPHERSRMSPRKKTPCSYRDENGGSEAENAQSGSKMQPKMTPKKSSCSKQIRLAPNTLSVLSLHPGLRAKAPPSIELDSPRKPKTQPVSKASEKLLDSDLGSSSDVLPEVDADESIWCGSGSSSSSDDSEDELPSPRKFLAISRKPARLPEFKGLMFQDQLPNLSHSTTFNGAVDSGVKHKAQTLPLKHLDQSSRPASSSDKENQEAFLRFSPPRLHKAPPGFSSTRPVTPPQSPSKSRLQSLSKTKPRIPTPPHRQSLDAFWDADVVNGWNEQHSPKTILRSPRKLKFLQEDSQQSPSSSPRKAQSPFKRTKAELEVKKTFEQAKHRIAEDFLTELDTVVTDGKIGELAASTGGVRFIWSKTLNSTAGRANWRRETTKTKHTDGTSSATHRHHASIELAEKVIDDEDRLLNVIAHEFCHLANFMLSGIKDQPHGRQFKEWGRKCTNAFSHRGVKVTTKHSYEIEYKYIWQCSNEDCAVEFKRHSKSVDPKRHTCGSCRSKLVQIKPVPRKTGENGQSGNGYAAYVKANFATVKKSLPGASQKQIMEAVAKKYREEKRVKELTDSKDGPIGDDTKSVELNQVAKALEVITIEDD